jgi:hypothetical protein
VERDFEVVKDMNEDKALVQMVFLWISSNLVVMLSKWRS